MREAKRREKTHSVDVYSKSSGKKKVKTVRKPSLKGDVHLPEFTPDRLSTLHSTESPTKGKKAPVSSGYKPLNKRPELSARIESMSTSFTQNQSIPTTDQSASMVHKVRRKKKFGRSKREQCTYLRSFRQNSRNAFDF